MALCRQLFYRVYESFQTLTYIIDVLLGHYIEKKELLEVAFNLELASLQFVLGEHHILDYLIIIPVFAFWIKKRCA